MSTCRHSVAWSSSRCRRAVAGKPGPPGARDAGGLLNSVGLQGPGVEAWLDDELPTLVERGAGGRQHLGAPSRSSNAPPRCSPAPRESSLSRSTSAVPNLEDRSRMFAHSPGPRLTPWPPRPIAAAPVGEAQPERGRPHRHRRRPPSRRCRGTRAGEHAARDGHRRRHGTYRLGSGPAGGGLSGPAISPVAVRAVHDCRAAFPLVGIVGVGGVTPRRGRRGDADGRCRRRGGGDGHVPRTAGPGSGAGRLSRWCRWHDVARVRTLVAAVHSAAAGILVVVDPDDKHRDDGRRQPRTTDDRRREARWRVTSATDWRWPSTSTIWWPHCAWPSGCARGSVSQSGSRAFLRRRTRGRARSFDRGLPGLPRSQVARHPHHRGPCGAGDRRTRRAVHHRAHRRRPGHGRAAVDGMAEGAAAAGMTAPCVLGVTVLTSDGRRAGRDLRARADVGGGGRVWGPRVRGGRPGRDASRRPRDSSPWSPGSGPPVWPTTTRRARPAPGRPYGPEPTFWSSGGAVTAAEDPEAVAAAVADEVAASVEAQSGCTPLGDGAMVASMPQPPALTPEQRQAALDKAAKVRRERAEVKEKLKMGSVSLSELLKRSEEDETVGKMKVLSVLESLPGLGKVKARRLMETVGISESRRLQGLGVESSARLCSRTSRSPDPRPLGPGWGGQRHRRRAPRGARSGFVAEPVVDHAGPSAGRIRRRLRVRRPDQFRKAGGRRWIPRVGRVPGPALRHAPPRATAGARRVAGDRPPGRGPGATSDIRRPSSCCCCPRRPRSRPSACGGVVTTRPRWPAASRSGPGRRRWGGPSPRIVVVNDDVDQAVAEVAGILEAHRRAGPDSPGGAPRGGA